MISFTSCHDQIKKNISPEKTKTIQTKKITLKSDNKITTEGIHKTNETTIIDYKSYDIKIEKNDKDYNTLKKEIRNKRLQFYNAYKNKKVSLEEIGLEFEKYLVNTIIPHWYGMKWDYSGYSEVPNKGEVGCSYFVSNTLKHMGLNVNRYKLAQKGPIGEAKSIAIDSLLLIKYIDVKKFTSIKEDILQLKEGIYFVGLSSHVGYLLKRNEELFFIHSNYLGDINVTIELAGESAAFTESTDFIIAPLSTNQIFIESWLKNDEIEIYIN